MVIFTLIDLSITAVSTVWWVTKSAFYTGKYIVYGRGKTNDELIEEKIDEKLEEKMRQMLTEQLLIEHDKPKLKRCHSL